MQNDRRRIRLLSEGRMAHARRREQDVILLQKDILCSTAVFLTAMQKDVEFVFVRMPVIAVVHNVMRKAADRKPFPGPFHLVIGEIHLLLPLKSKHFPCVKFSERNFLRSCLFQDNGQNISCQLIF